MYTVIYKQEAAGRTPEWWQVAIVSGEESLEQKLNMLSKEGYTIFQVLYRGK